MKRKTIFLFLGSVMLALFMLGAAGLIRLGSTENGTKNEEKDGRTPFAGRSGIGIIIMWWDGQKNI